MKVSSSDLAKVITDPFIGTFVREETPWVHLDIAGVAWNDKATAIKASPGSTSFGIRLLNGYIKQHFEKN